MLEVCMNKYFIQGFVKSAVLKINPVLGGKIHMISGDHKIKERLFDRLHVMGLPRQMFTAKERDQILKKMEQKRIGGTEFTGGQIAKGKNKSKAYINREVALNSGRLKELVHHELFHKNVPILGHSEILARLWGGAHSKRNKIKNTLQTMNELSHVDPERLKTELALGGLSVAGGLYGAHKLKSKKSD